MYRAVDNARSLTRVVDLSRVMLGSETLHVSYVHGKKVEI